MPIAKDAGKHLHFSFSHGSGSIICVASVWVAFGVMACL